MRPTKLIWAFVLCLITSVSYAQVKTTKEQTINACDKFMKHFIEGKYGESLQVLKQFSVIDHTTIDELEKTLKEQMENASDYGKMLSYEFVQEKKIKDLVSKRFYLMKLEKYYLKFAFTMYNNNGDWKITNFDFDDEIGEILQ